jgi:PAS domain S-box-containing protein
MTTIAEPGIFEAWLGASDDGAIAVDARGTVVLHNPAASRVTGMPPEAALARPWRDVLHIDDGLAGQLWSARTQSGPARVVADIACAQGNTRTAEIVSTPWRDESGAAAGILIVIRDIATLCHQCRAPRGIAGFGNLIGELPRMQELYRLIEIVGPSDAPVVIEGETGVGKELVAQLLHACSTRAERPFVVVHCAALAEGVIESELFGHVRGAFTGAVRTTLGRFERANTGTIFLDEVSEIPPGTQVKLLRVLQSGEMERVGDATGRQVDVRVIAASNRPLDLEVERGRFRRDLYYRLRVVRIEIPPLRERASDIPLLVEHFLARYAPTGRCDVTPAAMAMLQAAPWPGNVRELENAIRHAVTLRPNGPLTPDVFPVEVRAALPPERPLLVEREPSVEERRALLVRALADHHGNRTEAARALGIGRATFYRWWHEAGLADFPSRHGRGETSETLVRQARDR